MAVWEVLINEQRFAKRDKTELQLSPRGRHKNAATRTACWCLRAYYWWLGATDQMCWNDASHQKKTLSMTPKAGHLQSFMHPNVFSFYSACLIGKGTIYLVFMAGFNDKKNETIYCMYKLVTSPQDSRGATVTNHTCRRKKMLLMDKLRVWMMAKNGCAWI